MMKINKTHIAQIVLITFLGFALIAPIAPADADTAITLQGQINSADITINISKSTMELDIGRQSEGQQEINNTTATDIITVTSTAYVPVKMTLKSVAHKAESWSPTLIAEDPTTLGLADAQNKARLTFNSVTDDPDYAVAPPDQIIPTSTEDKSITLPRTDLGVIADTDGKVGKAVVITGKLEVSPKRILSKAFNSEMVLNFEA